MSTPFLLAYATGIIDRLVARDLLLLQPDGRDAAIEALAASLAAVKRGSILSSTTAGLLKAPTVEELFADDDDLRDILDEMGQT